jgi:hypothetical protein
MFPLLSGHAHSRTLPGMPTFVWLLTLTGTAEMAAFSLYAGRTAPLALWFGGWCRLRGTVSGFVLLRDRGEAFA